MRVSLLVIVFLSACTGRGSIDGGGDDVPVIEAGDVAAGDVQAGAVSAGDVQAGAVSAGDVEAGTVLAGAVQAGDLVVGAVGAGDVHAGNVSAGNVQAGDVAAGDVLAGDVLAGDVLIDAVNVTGVRDLAPSVGQLDLVWLSSSADPGTDWRTARASVCAGGVPVEVKVVWNDLWDRPGVLVAVRCP